MQEKGERINNIIINKRETLIKPGNIISILASILSGHGIHLTYLTLNEDNRLNPF